MAGYEGLEFSLGGEGPVPGEGTICRYPKLWLCGLELPKLWLGNSLWSPRGTADFRTWSPENLNGTFLQDGVCFDLSYKADQTGNGTTSSHASEDIRLA